MVYLTGWMVTPLPEIDRAQIWQGNLEDRYECVKSKQLWNTQEDSQVDRILETLKAQQYKYVSQLHREGNWSTACEWP